MTLIATRSVTELLAAFFVTVGVILLLAAPLVNTGPRHELLDERGRHKRPRSTDLLDRLVARSILLTVLAAFAAIYLDVGISWIGATMIGAMVTKLTIAELHRRRENFGAAPLGLRVCAVMPIHNEDPAYAVAGVASMLAQTRPLHRIHVVDDGSTDGAAAADAVRSHLEASAGSVQWEVTVLAVNVGKRHALAHGFRAAVDADVFLCVDSDTVLQPDAVIEGLRPFSDPGVSAVAGLVSAHNRRRNLLTRLIDLRYVSAFLSERAAYSAFGAVLCCCGSLSFYRSEVVRANLDDFLGQYFLGRTATFGDDRRLTNYALRSGKVVLAERSRAATAVPERLSHYVRQQVRWNKSFFRESLWVLSTFPMRSAAFWLTVSEVAMCVVMGAALVVAVALYPMLGHVTHVRATVVFVMLAAWARNSAYLEHRREGVRRRDRAFVFAIAPIYGLLHIFVLVPVRVYALLTLRQGKWGTRGKVEVRL